MNTTRTPAFLMANLGIEVERLHIANEQHDEVGFSSAQARASRIIGQLRTHPEMQVRLIEVDALETSIALIGKSDPSSSIPRAQFLAYFSSFSARALA
jgi:hypothetical protein